MRIRLGKVILIMLLVLPALGLSGCNTTAEKATTDKAFEQSIDDKLYKITHPEDIKVKVSSNPYDYIKTGEGLNNYKFIISYSDKSLNYMLGKFENSGDNGLEEYIMAIACTEILKENPDNKNWASGKEWYNNYIKAKNKNKNSK